MGASLASPSAGKSRFGKNYHLDNFPTSRIPASKSTIGFRDKTSSNHNVNSSKNSFINSLSLKKLNINSNKKRHNQINNQINSTKCSNSNNINNNNNNNNNNNGDTVINHFNSNGLPQSIPTICGSVNDSLYQEVYANKSTVPNQYIKPQPPAPSHHNARLSSKNLTKSLSCYTLKFNSKIEGCSDRKTTVIHASTSELLKCLGTYVCQECNKLDNLQPESVVSWIRALDRSLILQGWSEIAFINPANVVFLYMLVKFCINDNIRTERELQCIILTCLYLAYSYMGNEISYPLKPFLVDENRDVFWERCIALVNSCSSLMLSINANSSEFTEYFSELKSYSSY